MIDDPASATKTFVICLYAQISLKLAGHGPLRQKPATATSTCIASTFSQSANAVWKISSQKEEVWSAL